MGTGVPGVHPRVPTQGGGRLPALTDHDNAEDEVADLLQELGPERQQQPGHHLQPAHCHQVPARLRHEPELLQRKDLGEAHELRLLGRAVGERSCAEPGRGDTAPPAGSARLSPAPQRARLPSQRSALRPRGRPCTPRASPAAAAPRPVAPRGRAHHVLVQVDRELLRELGDARQQEEDTEQHAQGGERRRHGGDGREDGREDGRAGPDGRGGAARITPGAGRSRPPQARGAAGAGGA